MMIGFAGKRKKPADNLPVLGSLLSDSLKTIASRGLNDAALGSLPHYPSQTASSHAHNLTRTLSPNRVSITKTGGLHLRRKKKKKSLGGSATASGFTSYFSKSFSSFPSSPRKGKPLWKQTAGCAGRRRGCFLLLTFLSTPCSFGGSKRCFKSFLAQAALHLKFLEKVNCVQGRHIKLLNLATRQSSVFKCKQPVSVLFFLSNHVLEKCIYNTYFTSLNTYFLYCIENKKTFYYPEIKCNLRQ